KRHFARRTTSSNAAIARWNGLPKVALPSCLSMSRRRSGNASSAIRRASGLMLDGPSPCTVLRLTPDLRNFHFGSRIELDVEVVGHGSTGPPGIGNDIFVP